MTHKAEVDIFIFGQYQQVVAVFIHSCRITRNPCFRRYCSVYPVPPLPCRKDCRYQPVPGGDFFNLSGWISIRLLFEFGNYYHLKILYNYKLSTLLIVSLLPKEGLRKIDKFTHHFMFFQNIFHHPSQIC